MDFLILEAYGIFQGELCPQCHMPTYLCHNENVQWDVFDDGCAATSEVESFKKALSAADKDYEAPAGVIYYPKPFMIDDSDPAAQRDQHYENERLKRLEAENPTA